MALPACPKCRQTAEEPNGSPQYGNMMILRCQIIVETDWCVFCRRCKIHFHAPGRPVPKKER